MSNGWILKKRFSRDGIMVEEDVKIKTYKLEDLQLNYIGRKGIIVKEIETKECCFIPKMSYNKLLTGEHIIATIETVVLKGEKVSFFKTLKW